MQAIDLINKLAVELDIDAAMRSVRDCALELLECDRVTLFLIIESRRELRLADVSSGTVSRWTMGVHHLSSGSSVAAACSR